MIHPSSTRLHGPRRPSTHINPDGVARVRDRSNRRHRRRVGSVESSCGSGLHRYRKTSRHDRCEQNYFAGHELNPSYFTSFL